MEELIDRIQNVSVNRPDRKQFRFGLPVDYMLQDDPFAEPEEMTYDQATAILTMAWDKFMAIPDPFVREEAFIFSRVFGDDIAIWLLSEACRVEKIGRHYVMTEPPNDPVISEAMIVKVSTDGQKILSNFRRLVAGYVGWINRVA